MNTDLKTDFESVIGLEIHIQTATRSKMFCRCPAGAKSELAPNAAICPVCTAQPGALPSINQEAVTLAVKAALALNAKINKTSVFARKNYFYPDLPKGYQITQDDKPICEHGFIEIPSSSAAAALKKIRITRAHMEEDAGKSIHGEDCSLIDLNRSGVPLLEIVSEPDISSPQEACDYLTALKSLMQWFDISACDMEKGELRVDVNLSLRPKGQKEFGTRIEIKNLNSFKAVKDALAYEISRQSKVLQNGGKITQETRLWDDVLLETKPMRSKESAQEYRYFPEPDLPPLVLSEKRIEDIKKSMPKNPGEKRKEFEETLSLSPYDAGLMTSSKALCDYFERALACGAKAKAAANWIGTDILGKLNESNLDISACPLAPKELASLISYIESGKLSVKMAKEVFAKAWDGGKTVKELIETEGQTQVSDEALLKTWAEEAASENPKAFADFKGGNQKAVGALVGCVMKKSKGKANPAVLNKIFREMLK